MAQVEYNQYLPSYRSLLTPNAKYDYRTHLVVELTQLELQRIESRFQIERAPPKSRKLKMKYKSLLDDVSRKALILSLRVQLNLHGQQQTLKATKQLWTRCKSFSQLPLELQFLVFSYIDELPAYYSAMFVCKRFYLLAKPFLYRKVSFLSTYRFAQFVTILRLNPSLGMYVVEVDLSQIRPGNWWAENPVDGSHDETSGEKVLAGWRDWKFKTSPLYAVHVTPHQPLMKTVSNSSMSLHQSQKKAKLSKYFKRRRPSSAAVYSAIHENSSAVNPTTLHPATMGTHPTINRFLYNYSAFKDVPVGYVIHLINLCPNLTSANFGNLSLLTDYRIVSKMAYKYQPYDLMHNYHKDLRKIVDSILPSSLQTSFNPFGPDGSTISYTGSTFDPKSSVSSVFSLNFSQPIRKYNSLLPPLPNSSTEMLYLSRADGMIFLSDLNVKSISRSDLTLVPENSIFQCLAKRADMLREITMSSMIWINAKMVADFLKKMVEADLVSHPGVDKERLLFHGVDYKVGEKIDGRKVRAPELALRILDLRDSGMNKNLDWAQKIDISTAKGQRLVQRIVNDELVSTFEEYVIQESIRRGRIGENYFS